MREGVRRYDGSIVESALWKALVSMKRGFCLVLFDTGTLMKGFKQRSDIIRFHFGKMTLQQPERVD